jgi:MFS transporter, CP family, cyanate transporter
MSDPAAPPAVQATGSTRRYSWAPVLFIAGMLALAFNLRAAITSLPPVFPELESALHLPSAAIAALAAVPVLCFAVFSPVAAPLSRRFGEERVLLAALVLLAVGLLARGALPSVLLFPGTVVAAGAIALMNVLLPSLVKRRRPGHAGLLIGTYLLSMSAGAVLGSLIAVPVYQASGGSIPLTLGLWALPALAAALVWLPQWRFRTAPASPGGGPRDRRRPVKPSRYLLAWQVMGFMGLQSLTYYTALSWLPTLFRDRGAGAVHAGFLLALMNLGGALTALLAPVLAQRARDQRMLVAATVAVSAVGLAGAWFAPLSTAVFWTLLLGVGQGAALGLAIYLTTARAPDPASAASLGSFAQGGGYLIATVGPLAFGFLHAVTGNWTVPVITLLGVFAAEAAAGLGAGRARTLPLPEPAG